MWGGVAIVVCLIIVGISVLLYKQKAKTPEEGYGASRDSVSSVLDGAIAVNNGSVPRLVLDMYSDPMCTNCVLFQTQFGQQMNKAIDEGKLQVNYHLVTVDNGNSMSGDYSTRAAGALLCVGADTAAPKGTFLKFYDELFSDGTQPQSDTGTDLSNQQLAALAKKDGAGAVAQACTSSGAQVPAAKSSADASSAALKKAVNGVPEIAVLQAGKPVNINSADWLSDLLGS